MTGFLSDEEMAKRQRPVVGSPVAGQWGRGPSGDNYTLGFNLDDALGALTTAQSPFREGFRNPQPMSQPNHGPAPTAGNAPNLANIIELILGQGGQAPASPPAAQPPAMTQPIGQPAPSPFGGGNPFADQSAGQVNMPDALQILRDTGHYDAWSSHDARLSDARNKGRSWVSDYADNDTPDEFVQWLLNTGVLDQRGLDRRYGQPAPATPRAPIAYR